MLLEPQIYSLTSKVHIATYLPNKLELSGVACCPNNLETRPYYTSVRTTLTKPIRNTDVVNAVVLLILVDRFYML